MADRVFVSVRIADAHLAPLKRLMLSTSLSRFVHRAYAAPVDTATPGAPLPRSTHNPTQSPRAILQHLFKRDKSISYPS